MSLVGWFFGGDTGWEFHRFVDLFEFIPRTVFSLIGAELQHSSLGNLLQRLQGKLFLH